MTLSSWATCGEPSLSWGNSKGRTKPKKNTTNAVIAKIFSPAIYCAGSSLSFSPQHCCGLFPREVHLHHFREHGNLSKRKPALPASNGYILNTNDYQLSTLVAQRSLSKRSVVPRLLLTWSSAGGQLSTNPSWPSLTSQVLYLAKG